ncbi:flavodoxin family protein [Pelagibacterium sediminicola]|uniref:flavodoxin family protein n=1 Tax=Pelagibacterium sediminicola TaxID=2248761 RepID=UPI000E3113D0|nr:flavodoxin family protein [Pelagibacterium sediminicola]
MPSQELTAIALNGTLKSSSAGSPSSTDRMLDLFEAELKKLNCTMERVRLADFNIKPGVSSDEGSGDQWPDIRRRIVAADIVIAGSPVWMGQPSSVIKRVLERMDAFLSDTDESGRMPSYGKVALVATVGNEDGAHHVSAELYQALNDVGFSLAPNAVGYWVGEAMGSTDFKDLDSIPEGVSTAVHMAAVCAVHMAGLLKQHPFPSVN